MLIYRNVPMFLKKVLIETFLKKIQKSFKKNNQFFKNLFNYFLLSFFLGT